jgi:hypothetical protein
MKFLSKLRFRVSHRVAVEAVHDLLLFIGAFVATGVLDQPSVDKQALVAAAVTALRVVLRGLIPAPIEGQVEKQVLHLVTKLLGASATATTGAVQSSAVAPAAVVADVPPPTVPASPVA